MRESTSLITCLATLLIIATRNWNLNRESTSRGDRAWRDGTHVSRQTCWTSSWLYFSNSNKERFTFGTTITPMVPNVRSSLLLISTCSWIPSLLSIPKRGMSYMAMTSIFDEEIEIISDLGGGSYISAPILDEGLKPQAWRLRIWAIMAWYGNPIMITWRSPLWVRQSNFTWKN